MTLPIAIALIVTLDLTLIALLAFVMALPRRLALHGERAAQPRELHPRARVEFVYAERHPAAA